MTVALATTSAFAGHYKWTAEQINNNQVFASVEEAVAAGYNTMWTSQNYLGMPAQDLIKNDEVTVSLAAPFNYVSVGNSKYSGAKTYGYKIIMGMNNSTRDGIDPTAFANGLNENNYVRKAGDSDQANVVNDAIIKIETTATPEGSDPWTSAITLGVNRGGNLAAIYVVDATKQKMVLQSQMRNYASNITTDYFRFQVEQGHTYYVLASEKGSAELYSIAYDSADDMEGELLATEENCTDLWTCSSINNNEVFESVDAAVAAGYNTMWTSQNYLGMPAQKLIDSENITVELANPFNYVSVGNGKYAGAKKYGYKLIMGMNNSTRDGIDATAFAEGLTDNKYVRKSGDSDQGNVINDAIIKVTAPEVTEGDPYCGRFMINWSRGGNAGALYVVDATKSKMEMQEISRAIGDGNNKEMTSIFEVYPGRTYYILCSEKGSVEIYRIGFCDARSEKFGKLFDTTNAIAAIQSAPAKDNIMYNILGQRVTNAKGIIIMNGRKMIIK